MRQYIINRIIYIMLICYTYYNDFQFFFFNISYLNNIKNLVAQLTVDTLLWSSSKLLQNKVTFIVNNNNN